MKKILYTIPFCLILLAVISCSEFDNYAIPSETLKGSVTDHATGEPIQTEVGGGGIRIKLEELSWSDNPTPYYFYAMQDGTFDNTRIFKGNYRISVEGPFVPLIQYDNTGNIVVDNSKTMDIEGVTEVNFEVEPFLKVEWLDDPVVNNDKSVTATIRFVRGTDNPAYQIDVTDVYLFANPNPYVGNNNFDNRYSTQVSYAGTEGDAQIGQPITITTNGPLPGNRSWYVRVGARVSSDLKQYNYNDVKVVDIP